MDEQLNDVLDAVHVADSENNDKRNNKTTRSKALSSSSSFEHDDGQP